MNLEKIEICKSEIVDREKIARVAQALPQQKEIFQLAQTFKALSDPTRLQIVLALSQDELCVCDLAALLQVSVSAVSHQLRLLKTQRLVNYRKEGKMVFYSLDDRHIDELIGAATEHVHE